MTDSTTRSILRSIESDGYCISTINHVILGGGIQYIAWRDNGLGYRRSEDEMWTAKGADEYEAAVELAQMLGWELEG